MKGDLIKSEYSGTQDLVPEILAKAGIKDYGPKGFEDCTIKPLSQAILLRGVCVRESLLDGMLATVFLQLKIGEFSSTIGVDDLRMVANAFCLEINGKTQRIKDIALPNEGDSGTESRVQIDYGQYALVFPMRHWADWADNIQVYLLKRF